MEHLAASLGDRLDVIEAALEVALHEPASPDKDLLLAALTRATSVVRSQSDDLEARRRRSAFRLVPGLSEAGALDAPDGRWTARTQGRAR